MKAVCKRMKIALVVPAFPKLSETFIVNKLLGLLGEGWDVHVVCAESDPREWSRFPGLREGENDVKRRVHTIMPTRSRWLAALLLPIVLLRCISTNPTGAMHYLWRGRKRFGLDILRRLYIDAGLVMQKPDIVHFEFGALAVGRTYLKDLLGSKVVVSFRGYDLNFSGLERPGYYDEVWEEADTIHLLGEDLWRRAQCRGCPPVKRHVLIPPAIDAEFFDPGNRAHTEVAGVAVRPLRLISVGRLEWKKGYEYGLQAVKLLRDSGLNCEYRIVGDGAYLEAVAFARHQFALEDSVHLLGALPRDQVKEQMLWADVLLHSAVSEGFCNAVMEAQSMMLPVVCSDADGLRENVSDGITGYVVPRRQPESLASKLALLSARPELRQQMGRAGRDRVIERFQLHNQVRAFSNLYMQLLGPEGAPEEVASASPRTTAGSVPHQ